MLQFPQGSRWRFEGMGVVDRAGKYCIIGAGASGLAVAKNFKLNGIAFECLEREPDIGGLWNFDTKTGVVYETTHLVSAAFSTWFDDFPMDEDVLPAYPSHAQVLAYFRDYVRHFGIEPHIMLGCTVERAAPRDDGRWDVKIAGEAAPRVYRGVVLANGHHHKPRIPAYPGRFAGEMLHSSAYRTPRQLRDRRVLVVGAGNSACDIARDAAHASGSVVNMSFRRGYWFVPKFMLGFPTYDLVATTEMIPMPRFLRRFLFEAGLWLLQGPPSRYKLPDPDYHIDQAHPTMSDDIPRLSAHGRIKIRPEIERFDGRRVVFKDGTSEEIDTVIFATGYQIEFPFIDNDLINDASGRPNFFAHAFHPEHDNLFAAGLIQANGSIWRLADYQGRLMARFINAQDRAPAKARWFRRKKAAGRTPDTGAFVASDRHLLEANYFDYRRQLKRLTRRFGRKLAACETTVPLSHPSTGLEWSTGTAAQFDRQSPERARRVGAK
jgi:cation diffusion facilitator CzcD-associated flavoprotein CzcO